MSSDFDYKTYSIDDTSSEDYENSGSAEEEDEETVSGFSSGSNEDNYPEIFKTTNWTLEKGYKTNAFDTYPERVFGPGEKFGLHIKILLMHGDAEQGKFCRTNPGYKIFLHPPVEFPQVSKQHIRVIHENHIVISVKPNLMTTSEGLAKYTPERRQCYFNNERNLQFFAVYTQKNCETECLANVTFRICNCVKFSMPRTNSTRVCGQKDLKCLNRIADIVLQQEVDESSCDKYDSQNKRNDCSCLPSCTSISYDAERSTIQPDFNLLFKKRFLPRFNESRIIIPASVDAIIFFKEAQFIKSIRSEVYDWTDFTANCGGLLGECPEKKST